MAGLEQRTTQLARVAQTKVDNWSTLSDNDKLQIIDEVYRHNSDHAHGNSDKYRILFPYKWHSQYGFRPASIIADFEGVVLS